MCLLVTGGNGFIANQLLRLLAKNPKRLVKCSLRSKTHTPPDNIHTFYIENIDANTDWGLALMNCQEVIHTAAKVHIMADFDGDPLTEFRRINVEGTLNLARQAVKAGVKRFIFISSVKVNGEYTEANLPYNEDMQPMPSDPYSISKFEAEKELQVLSQETGMDVVIIRPPLVYGVGVKGNFRSMLSCVKKGIPLPLGAIHNKRSLISLDNLVNLIIICIDHPNAANQTFLVSDGEDLSTSELLKKIGKALGLPVKLISVPVKVLFFAAYFLRKKSVAQRLCGSLQVDISKVRGLLGWEPPVSVDEGLKRTVKNLDKSKLSTKEVVKNPV